MLSWIFKGISSAYTVKSKKTIGLLLKLHNTLPRLPLLTIYNFFVRLHLDYGDIIYDQVYTTSFHQKIESVQYNSAITGAIRGASKEKLYQEVGLETLEKVRWYRRQCCFFKIFRNQSPKYLFNIIPIYRWHNPKGAKLLTRLRLGLSHLWEHKFKHGFLDSLNPICSCGQDFETSTHFLLHCSNYSNKRSSFLNIISNIDRNILDKNHLKVTGTLLHGDSSSDNTKKTLIMNATMEFLIATKRSDVPLVQIEWGLVYC